MKLTNIDFSNIKNKLEGIWNALESFAIAHKEILINIFIIVCVVTAAIMIFKKLMTMGVNMLMGILTIAFLIIVTPKLSNFLLNKFEKYDYLEQRISEVVDEDMTIKVKCEYKRETGQELTDPTLLDQLKAEKYQVDPELSDDMNMLLNAGFPEGVNNTIRMNISDYGDSQIQANCFSDYVAKYYILRMTEGIALFVAFCVATKIFRTEKDYCYAYI